MMKPGEFPAWLEVLLKEKFFNACLEHEDVKKNEKNILCIDCCISICPHCLSSHTSHRLLQIRRYVYRDVLRIEDGSKLMDCSLIQPYITHSSKVVFINERRPQSRQFRGSGNICITCHRCLKSPYIFCSLSCKISDVMMKQRGLSGFLRVFNVLNLTDEVMTMTPSSTLETTGSTRTSSESGGNGGGVDMFWCQALACTPTTEIVRKKRSRLTKNCRRVTDVVGSPTNTPAPVNYLNRRKNTPDEVMTMTPSSTLETTGSTRTSSESGGNGGGVDMFWCQALACTPTTEIVRKKRSRLTKNCRRVADVVGSPTNTPAPVNYLNRRKNTPPQRAPLY